MENLAHGYGKRFPMLPLLSAPFFFFFASLLVFFTEIAEDAFRFVVAAGVKGNDIAELKAPLRSSEYSSWVMHS